MKIDFLLLPHSTSQDPSDILVPAKEKLAAYITYREERLQQLFEAVKSCCEARSEGATREELY